MLQVSLTHVFVLSTSNAHNEYKADDDMKKKEKEEKSFFRP